MDSKILSQSFDLLMEQYRLLILKAISIIDDPTNKLRTEIRMGFNEVNPCIIINIETSEVYCNVGVWTSETADISVFQVSTGDSLYEYHKSFDNFDDLHQAITKAFSLISF